MVSNDEKTFAYDTTWKDKLISYNGQSIIYDESGNPTNYMGTELSWTMGRQLASFGDISYKYDENGIRTSKTVDGVTTKFYLDGANVIEQTDGITTLHFYYDSSGEILGFNYNNNDYFYVKNAMSDILAITDKDGNVVAEYTYDPWGKVVDVTGSNVALGNLNPFRYRSYYYDSDIGMYYLQSRYYDPEICRFINCDDVNYIGITESEISYNPFAYCENEPVNRYDPEGTGYYYIYSTYQKLEKNLYFINTDIKYIIGNRLSKSLSTFYILDKKVIRMSNAVPAVDRIIKNNCSYYLAKGMYKTVKTIDQENLKGRTVKGIQLEILVHYYCYKLGIRISSTRVSDIGGTNVDRNAKIFEMRKYLDYLAFLAAVSNPIAALAVVMLFISYL